MKHIRTLIFFATALCVVAVGAAFAADYGTVTAQVGQDFKLNIASKITYLEPDWYVGPTGRFTFIYSNMNPADLGILPVGFCVDPQTINIGGTYDYDVNAPENVPQSPEGPMGAAKADWLSELWGRHYASVNSNITGAAFALAAYEIVFEDPQNGWDILSGQFLARDDGGDVTAAIGLADTWVNSLDGTGPRASLRGLSNPDRQDFIVPHVPEPGSLAVLLSGIGALGGMFVRRKK